MIGSMGLIGIVDIFSGPGGLGEGFCPASASSDWPFRIAVSVEKDTAAYETLLLRSFVRKFDGKLRPVTTNLSTRPSTAWLSAARHSRF